MTESPEYRALLDAVLDRPDDDFPRLAMADWLADKGYDVFTKIKWPLRIRRAMSVSFCPNGFVIGITCTLADFLRNAAWVANNWPVREVTITVGGIDQRPSRQDYLTVLSNLQTIWEYSVVDAPDISSEVAERFMNIWRVVSNEKTSQAFTTFPSEDSIVGEACVRFLRELRRESSVRPPMPPQPMRL